MAMVDGYVVGLIGVGGMILGALLGILGGFKLARYNDRLARKQEADKEEREFKRGLRMQRHKEEQQPRIEVLFDVETPDCIYRHDYQERKRRPGRGVFNLQADNMIDWYVSAVVRNAGKWTAKRCIGTLEKVERKEEDVFVEQPIGGRLPLVWAFNEQNVDLAANAKKPLNIFIVRAAGVPFELQLQDGVPAPVQKACGQLGTYLLTIQIASDNAESKMIVLGVKWDGTWNGTWTDEFVWVEEQSIGGKDESTDEKQRERE